MPTNSGMYVLDCFLIGTIPDLKNNLIHKVTHQTVTFTFLHFF